MTSSDVVIITHHMGGMIPHAGAWEAVIADRGERMRFSRPSQHRVPTEHIGSRNALLETVRQVGDAGLEL